jgi:hypothetical protein
MDRLWKLWSTFDVSCALIRELTGQAEYQRFGYDVFMSWRYLSSVPLLGHTKTSDKVLVYRSQNSSVKGLEKKKTWNWFQITHHAHQITLRPRSSSERNRTNAPGSIDLLYNKRIYILVPFEWGLEDLKYALNQLGNVFPQPVVNKHLLLVKQLDPCIGSTYADGRTVEREFLWLA